MVARLAQQSRRTAFVVPAVCWVLALLILLASSFAQDADPSLARGVPEPGTGSWWSAVAVLTLQATVLGRWRAYPRVVLLVVAALVPALADLGEAVGVGLVAVLVAAFLAVVARPVRPLGPTLLGAGLLVATGVTTADLLTAAELGQAGSWPAALVAGALQGVAAVALPYGLAAVVGARRDAEAASARTAAAQARERDALVRVAVERERTAMARELHDIAAHHLSGIAVVSAAVARQIDVDPEGAKQAVAQVREQSTAMLRDLRNLVVLLRDTQAPAEPVGSVRVETLAGLERLVDRARATGLDVTLETVGPVAQVAASGQVGPLAQLAAYRVVQEALANVVRHAHGTRCTVHVAAGAAAVDVVVRNDAPPAGAGPLDHDPGYGLVGMRERAELTGAALRYGPTPDGGWQVALTLPVAGAAVGTEEDR